MISTKGRSLTANRVHLPDLGRRGEGWVVLQVLLFVAIIGAGFLGPLWERPGSDWSGRSPDVALITSGVGLVTAGILGLRRQLTAYPRPVPGGRLIEDGVFGLVRHPMYGGGVIAAVGWGLVMALADGPRGRHRRSASSSTSSHAARRRGWASSSPATRPTGGARAG